jgi:DNA modification methylase
MTYALHHHDARHLSTLLAPDSVDLIVTSPPYFALRSYRDGGEHYDGQLGSEPTPGEFVDALIACTADWLKVLKPTGSLWVNLGDSYAGSGGYNNSAIGADGRGPSSYRKSKHGNSKDGRPAQWTLSSATWLAGVIDCDGSISARYFQTGNSPSVVPCVRVGMMDAEVVMRCAEITGVGRVFKDKRDVWNWSVSSQAAGYILERIWPYLLIKQRQALAGVAICAHIRDCKNRGRWNPVTDEQAAYRRTAVSAIHAWNRREDHPWTPPAADRLPLPHAPIEPKAKSLHGLPWRYALRCIDELGLILRAEVIWSKPNGLPESVTDRVRRSHEQWFHFTREGRYFAAIDEVREAQSQPERIGTIESSYSTRRLDGGANQGFGLAGPHVRDYNPLGKVPGSVWSIPSEPLTVPDDLGVDHFAAFPSEWPRRIILGWSPSGYCTACGEARRAVMEKDAISKRLDRSTSWIVGSADYRGNTDQNTGYAIARDVVTITGYACACACPDTDATTTPATVLDPFCGTGTAPAVAHLLGRHGIGTDLSRDYLRLAEWRCTADRALRDKVLDRTGIPNPQAPKVDGQLGLFGETA